MNTRKLMLTFLSLFCVGIISANSIPESDGQTPTAQSQDVHAAQYAELVQRLSPTPPLLKLFEEVHVPEALTSIDTFVEKRYQFDRELARYELTPRLKKSINIFNDAMMPRKRKSFWKRKGFLIPASVLMAVAVMAGGVAIRRRSNEKEEEKRIDEQRREAEFRELYQRFLRDTADKGEQHLSLEEYRTVLVNQLGSFNGMKEW